MEIFKIAALALCSIVMILLVKQYKPEFGVYTAIVCSIIILFFLTDSIKYSYAYIAQVYQQIEHGKTYFPILIKVLTIAYITEFTVQLCKDAGESSIATKIELGGKIMIFCVAIPVFKSIFTLIEQLL